MSTKMAYDQSPDWQRRALAVANRNFGISYDSGFEPKIFAKPEWMQDYQLALDAQPQLVTQASSSIPAYLSFFMDPDLLRVMTAELDAANIFTEVQKGDWTSSALLFPVVEKTYETSAYGDYNENGRAGINTNFPERQPFLFQVTCEYGDLEVERVGLAKIGFVAEQKQAAIWGLNEYANLTYFKGVSGLNNYGALNDPNLYPAIAPGPKSAGGIAWTNANGIIVATANEIFADVQALVGQLIAQSNGLIKTKSKFILALSPHSENALTATNSFNVNVADLLKKNYPNLEVKTAIQYGALSAQNTEGSAIGETVQLYCPDAAGQKSAFCAFNTKLRAGAVIRGTSSFKQKLMQGTAGFILRQPWALATGVGY